MAGCRGLVLLLAGVLVCLSAANAGGKMLVLLDNWAIKETHSIFFKSLKCKFVQSPVNLFVQLAGHVTVA